MPRKKFEFETNYDMLQTKLKELRELSKNFDYDINPEIRNIEERLASMVKDRYVNLNPWEQVLLARDSARPTARDYMEHLLSDWIELHGDRSYGDDAAIIGGIGLFEGIPVTVLGHQKGTNTSDNISHNFGMPHPEGFRKAHRLLLNAEKFQRPVFTFVNTPGAYPGVGAEERGQAWAISNLLITLSKIKVPVISLIAGEGGSGGALAIGVGDRLLILSNAVFSVASPEACATILFKDKERAPEMAKALKLDAENLKMFGIVDEIIPEPIFSDFNESDFYSRLKTIFSRYLNELSQKDLADLLQDRYLRYRKIGVFQE